MKKYGYWIIKNNEFFPGCYIKFVEDECHFNGIIASSRMTKFQKSKKIMLFIGVANKKYIQINIENIKYFDCTKIGIQGVAKALSDLDYKCSIFTCNKFKFY